MNLSTRRAIAAVATSAILSLALPACGNNATQSQSGASSSLDSKATSSVNDANAQNSQDADNSSKTGEANSSSSTDSASDVSEVEAKLGSIVEQTADAQGNSVISKETASNIFTFTLYGHTYTLPCRFQEFLDNGWTIDEKYAGVENETIDGGGIAGIVLNYQGNPEHTLTVSPAKLGDEPVTVKDSDVTAVEAWAGKDYDFDLGIGVSLNSPASELKEVFGYRAYNDNPTDKNVDLNMAFFSGPEDDRNTVPYGSVSYRISKTDNTVASIGISLGFNLANPLMAERAQQNNAS